MKPYFSFLFISVLLLSCNLSGDSEEEKRLIYSVKIGMSRGEVIKILGKPDAVLVSENDATETYMYFTRNKSGMRSVMPEVSFDTSGHVDFRVYGEND